MSARHTASRRVACFRRGLLYIVARCVSKVCPCTSANAAVPSWALPVSIPSPSPSHWPGDDIEWDPEEEVTGWQSQMSHAGLVTFTLSCLFTEAAVFGFLYDTQLGLYHNEHIVFVTNTVPTISVLLNPRKDITCSHSSLENIFYSPFKLALDYLTISLIILTTLLVLLWALLW